MNRCVNRGAGRFALCCLFAVVLSGCVKERQIAREVAPAQQDVSDPLVSGLAVSSLPPSPDTPQADLADPLADRLVLAARYGQHDRVRYLLASGARVNGHDRYGHTALVAAAANGQREVVDLLLLEGAAIDLRSLDGGTALMGAAAKGAHDLVDHLIEQGAVVDQRNQLGETALFMAVQSGHYEAARALLRAGADPNLHNGRPINVAESGYTPLMYAVTKGSTTAEVDWGAMTQLLLDSGADSELLDAQGETALSLASRIGHKAVVEVLKKAGAKRDTGYATLDNGAALLRAVRLGDGQKIDELVAMGTSVNFIDSNGITPLLAASFEGRQGVVKQLLRLGADINYMTSGLTPFALSNSYAPSRERALMEAASRGDTALIVASRQGHHGLVNYLLDQGAVIGYTNRQGETPLFVAIGRGDVALCQILIDRGANAKALEQVRRPGRMIAVKQGRVPHSALSYAVTKGHYPIAEMLLRAGAKIDYRSGEEGKTSLFLAVEKGYANIVKLLLDEGADPEIATVLGRTTLMAAAERGDELLVGLLLERGGEVNAVERPELGYGGRRHKGSDMTALMFAARGGHDEVVDLLLRAGAIASIHNSVGKTALQQALDNGHEVVAQRLRIAELQGRVVVSDM